MEPAKVIKVKYGDTLRRFNAFVDKNGRLGLGINGLRAKVVALFNLAPDADLTLTYVDEDGDVVTLVDDEDLHDMMRQGLKFLKINVLLKTEKDGRYDNSRSSGSSTPMRSPFKMHSFREGNAGLTEAIKSVPEPVLRAFSKLSTDFASKTVSSAPVLSDVLTCLAKMGESYLNTVPASEVGADSSTENRPSDNPMGPFGTEYTKASQSDCKQELKPIGVLKDLDPEFIGVGTSGSMPRGKGTSMASAATDAAAVLKQELKPIGVLKDLDQELKPIGVLKDLDPEFNGVGTSGSMPRGKGTSMASAAAAVDLNFPSSPDISEMPSFPSVTLTARIRSDVPVADSKETNKGSDVVTVAFNDHDFNKMKENMKGCDYAPVACSDCPSDGRNGTKKANAGSIASTSVTGYSGPKNNDPTTTPFSFNGWVNNKISSDSQNHAATDFGNSISDCPFTGIPLVNNSFWSPSPYHHSSSPHKRCHKDPVGGRFHKGIQCDGCGAYPIAGTRFKSKVKEDYDLCSICFSEIGNAADYMRMDWPTRHPHPWATKMRPPEVNSQAPLHPKKSCLRAGLPYLDSRFILDVNVVDGTAIAPSTPFIKTWRMRNTGNAVWARGTQLVWIGGDRFSTKDSVEICSECVPIGHELEISVDFTAPEFPGRYISYWRLATPSGQRFGQRVWVLIQVDYPKDLLGDLITTVINLNLPPSGGEPKRSQIIDVNIEPMVDGDLNEVNEPVAKPTVKEPANGDELLMLPLDSFLAIDVPGHVWEEKNSPVSYPIIDPSDHAPPISGVDQAALDQASMEEEMGKNSGVEEALLKTLNEMGFKCDEFNREILSLHGYNLEETVNHLCGVGEWDPILKELREMGFCDTELNKKLLRKNDGSIKRVVMDLIAVEKH